jgi:hypothetical protein
MSWEYSVISHNVRLFSMHNIIQAGHTIVVHALGSTLPLLTLHEENNLKSTHCFDLSLLYSFGVSASMTQQKKCDTNFWESNKIGKNQYLQQIIKLTNVNND